jgi:hypothetical protein
MDGFIVTCPACRVALPGWLDIAQAVVALQAHSVNCPQLQVLKQFFQLL